ncbi:MAG: hypothetical protein FWD64_13930 [Acidobacteriaceae bacterium]|nr:hypothetical protein [Acidobacteriaceae bacterium]
MKTASETIRSMLSAGRHKLSLARTAEVLACVQENPRRIGHLIECLWDEDAGVANRASVVLEKFTRERPGVLVRWKPQLLGLLAESTENVLRWHLAVIVPRLPLSASECRCVAKTLASWLDDASSIVKTQALQGLADLTAQAPFLLQDVTDLVRIHGRSGTPAMRARSRHLLKRLTRAAEARLR